MPYLLYELVTQEDPERQPIEALQSTVHWMQALAFEVTRLFPEPTSTQYAACRTFLAGTKQRVNGQASLARIYETLFHSLLNAMSLCSIAEACAGQPWTYGNAIVWWYYANYHAFRSMLYAHGEETKTHAGLINAATRTLGKRLPHPLNMLATRVKGEEYSSVLRDAPGVRSTSLLDGPVNDAAIAQGMLLGYLNGTATWNCEKIKDEIKRERRDITSFRSNAAKYLRDRQLPTYINFMNCSYRYLTKANYRDPLFLPYGKRQIVPADGFIEDLATTARFAFVFALAYMERKMGRKVVLELIADLRENMRNQDRGAGATHFWRDIPV